MLANVYSFARNFQNEKSLRHWLWKGGFMLKVKMKNDRPPSLLSQESASISSYVHIVFHLHDVATEENTEENTTDTTTEKKQKDCSNERKAVAEPKMIQICQQVLNKYIEIDLNIKQTTMKGHRAGLEELREKQMFLPIVVHILMEFEKNEDLFLRSHLSWLWPLMTRLIGAESVEIRTVLSRLMEQSMTTVVEAGVKALE